MIYTCDNCNSTFAADMRPYSCPDCGKEFINRRFDRKIKLMDAVRPATKEEISMYEVAQKELKFEDSLPALRDRMTVDEYNWSMIIHFEHQPDDLNVRPLFAEYIASLRLDPDRAAEHYRTIRRMFTKHLNDDRAALKAAGVSEPVSKPEGDLPDIFGPALRLLYRFKDDRNNPGSPAALPNLGSVRRINLEKIAREPSAAYTQFMMDWEESFS